MNKPSPTEKYINRFIEKYAMYRDDMLPYESMRRYMRESMRRVLKQAYRQGLVDMLFLVTRESRVEISEQEAAKLFKQFVKSL